MPDLDIVIPNDELAEEEEEEEEELPAPDVALLPHLKYGENSINSDFFQNFTHFYLWFGENFIFDTFSSL